MIDVPVLVKDALREGNKRKNYRIVVYQVDGETVDFTLDNDDLVSESVAFDERMCSDTNLKFGLCEGTSVEFQYFGHDNITGRRIQVFLDVQYTDTDGTDKWHSIPMGWFTVDETSRQASTGIRKVSAYNKLKSEYLNESANSEIIALVEQGEDGTDVMSFYKIIEHLLSEYSIEEYKKVEAQVYGQYSYYSESIGICTNASFSNVISVAMGVCYYEFSQSSPDYDRYGIAEFNKDFKNPVDDFFDFMSSSNVVLENGTEVPFSTAIQHPDWKIAVHKFTTPRTIIYVPISYFMGDVVAISDDEQTIYNMTENYVSNTHLFKNANFLFNFVYDYSGDQTAIGSNAQFQQYMGIFRSTYGWDIKAYRLEVPELAYKSLTLEQAQNLPDVTLRDIQSSVYETVCQYGKLNRVTDLFSGVELNNSRLYPADNLYPANDLYPNSISERSNPAMYEKLWADEGNVRSFRYLIITYKGVEQDDQGNLQEVEKKLQRTVDEHGTDNYNMSDNWIFKNLVWSDSDIGDYADAMVAKMQNVTWFPFEMWCAGLPYIETGDELEINMSDGAYTSYVLRRNLKGIQDLHDEMINGTLDIF